MTRCLPLGVGSKANPFTADAHAPGAIEWIDDGGTRGNTSLDAILDSIARRVEVGEAPHGQITGVHGVGKTTLLTHLAARARHRGWSIAESRPPALSWPSASRDGQTRPTPRIAFIDSADQMSRARWLLVRARARATGIVLVVTTHRDLGLNSLAQLRMSVERARLVLERLAHPAGLALPGDDELARMLASHDGSLRHVIFELYDHYERGWPW